MTTEPLPSPAQYQQMLEYRRRLLAEATALEIAELEKHITKLRKPLGPPVGVKPLVPAKEYLDDIAIMEITAPDDPELARLKLKAAAAEAFGWTRRSKIPRVQSMNARTDRQRAEKRTRR
jgi:hypothetical protein